MKVLNFKRFYASVRALIRSTIGTAGYDLFSAENKNIKKFGCETINTDIEMKIPKGTYGRKAPCSSLTLKHQINVGGGVIDSEFTDKVKVIISNHSSKPFEARVDCVAEIIFENIEFPDFIEVDELASTERGEKGLSSTEQ